MKRNLTRQADLQLRGFCHRLTAKQRKAVLWIPVSYTHLTLPTNSLV